MDHRRAAGEHLEQASGLTYLEEIETFDVRAELGEQASLSTDLTRTSTWCPRPSKSGTSDLPTTPVAPTTHTLI